MPKKKYTAEFKTKIVLTILEGSKEFKKLQRDVSKWSKDCPDTPRYKAMGNSIATPCLMWIGRRVEAFDILHYDEVGL